MESEVLVYKVEVVISRSNTDGQCRRVRYFDDLEEAKRFALSGGVSDDPWAQVTSQQLLVCRVVPEKELHYVKKEKTRQVIEITWEWE